MDRLFPLQARKAFDLLVEGLTRQHTRTRFRNRFGTGDEGLGVKIFPKAAVTADFDRVLRNLLQEQPGQVEVTRFQGAGDTRTAERWKVPDTSAFGELILKDAEQALMIQGRRARLCAYFAPWLEEVIVHRVVTELHETEPKKPSQPRPKVPRGPKQRSGNDRPAKAAKPSAARTRRPPNKR